MFITCICVYAYIMHAQQHIQLYTSHVCVFISLTPYTAIYTTYIRIAYTMYIYIERERDTGGRHERSVSWVVLLV